MRFTDKNEAYAGFSLIEMMVVVAVIGILIVAAVPNIAGSNKEHQVEAAANDMSARIQLARQRTLATRIPSRIVFDHDAGVYRFQRLLDGSTWTRDPDEDYAIPRGVGWSYAAGPDSSGNMVEFESRGTVAQADAPLSVVFDNDRGDAYALSLVRTGRVTVRCVTP